MSGFDLANVRRIERDNARLRDIISDLKREIEDLKRDPVRLKRQAISEGDRGEVLKLTKPATEPNVQKYHRKFPEMRAAMKPFGIIGLTPSQSALFLCLHNAMPAAVSKPELMDTLKQYGRGKTKPNGLHIAISLARKVIARHGWTIDTLDNAYRLLKLGSHHETL